MHVKINEEMVEIFSGARVEDVLRKYASKEWDLVRSGQRKIVDRHGHELDLSGELNGGEELQTLDCIPRKEET